MQAILIIAHTNAAQVYALTNKLIERFNVYIHFDRKYKMSEEYVEKFSAIPQVHVYSKYYVHWGAFSIKKSNGKWRKYLFSYYFRNGLACKRRKLHLPLL